MNNNNNNAVTNKMSTVKVGLPTTSIFNNSNGNAATIDPDSGIPWQRIALGVVLYGLVLVTVCGNALVLVAVARVKRLQTVFNVYIVNLAITDISVGLIAMNFFAAYNIAQTWPFEEIVCELWIYGDFGMTFASIFTLLTISLDRYWSVHWPNVYRVHNNKRKAVIATVLIWTSMLLLWTPAFVVDRINNRKSGECFYDPVKNKVFVIVVATIGYHGSTVVMIFCYVKVFIAVRQRNKITAALVPFSNPSGESITAPRVRSFPNNAPLEDQNASCNSNCYNNNRKLEESLPHPGSSSDGVQGPPPPCVATNKCCRNNTVEAPGMSDFCSNAVTAIARERPEAENLSCDNRTETLGQSEQSDVTFRFPAMGQPGTDNKGCPYNIEMEERYGQPATISNAAVAMKNTNTAHQPPAMAAVKDCHNDFTDVESSPSRSSVEIPVSVSFVEETSPSSPSPSKSRATAPRRFLHPDDATSNRVTETQAGIVNSLNGYLGNSNRLPTPDSFATLCVSTDCDSSSEVSTADRQQQQQNKSQNALQSSATSNITVNPRQSESTFNRVKRVLRSERKIFMTLTYVMAGYMVCWMPFHVSFDLMAIDRTLVPEWFYAVTYWLAYCNSAINPFLYNFSNSDFHSAFVKLIGRKRRRRS